MSEWLHMFGVLLAGAFSAGFGFVALLYLMEAFGRKPSERAKARRETAIGLAALVVCLALASVVAVSS